MTVRWQLIDPAGSDAYTFDANPNAGGTPPLKKNVSVSPTAAPDGLNVLFEGRRAPREMSFSGTGMDQIMHDKMATWWQKQRQVQLIDDLGRTYWIFISEFLPKRKKSSRQQKMYTFDCKAVILDWS